MPASDASGGVTTKPLRPSESTAKTNGSPFAPKSLILAVISALFSIAINGFMILLDNHDSFTWNLVELLRSLGKYNVNIVTPETLRISDLSSHDRIIFSPGPGLPQEQPAMFNVLNFVERVFREDSRKLPVLGVCLGMQAIVQHFGGMLFQQDQVIHGQPRKLNLIRPGHDLLRGIEQGTTVGLYHSWAVDKSTLPDCFEILAESEEERTIMAVSHNELPICGVQFHPESVISSNGRRLMKNWLEMA